MTATVHPLPVISPEPRRTVRDTPETLEGYLTRIGQPASPKTTAKALAHYRAELAIAEIYAAGFAAGQASRTLDGVTAASVTAIRAASGS